MRAFLFVIVASLTLGGCTDLRLLAPTDPPAVVVSTPPVVPIVVADPAPAPVPVVVPPTLPTPPLPPSIAPPDPIPHR